MQKPAANINIAQRHRCLSADLPGVGGQLKNHPDDFQVFELIELADPPLGDHLYLFTEKSDMTTDQATRLLGTHFQVDPRQIGYAGMKDRHAHTWQWFSIEHADRDHALTFEDPQLQILDCQYQPTKLHKGQAKANRFTITIRNVHPDAHSRAMAILEQLKQRGIPNAFGMQRFGVRRVNHELGRLMLIEDYRGFMDLLLGKPELAWETPDIHAARCAWDDGRPEEALQLWPHFCRAERYACKMAQKPGREREIVRKIDRRWTTLYLNAWQSDLFNQLLSLRIDNGQFDHLIEGDLVVTNTRPRWRPIDNMAIQQDQCQRMALHPTGPMYGAKVMLADKQAGALERQVLASSGIDLLRLQTSQIKLLGTRRSLRLRLDEIDCQLLNNDGFTDLQVRFTLPPGGYATAVLQEIIKPDEEGHDPHDGRY